MASGGRKKKTKPKPASWANRQVLRARRVSHRVTTQLAKIKVWAKTRLDVVITIKRSSWPWEEKVIFKSSAPELVTHEHNFFSDRLDEQKGDLYSCKNLVKLIAACILGAYLCHLWVFFFLRLTIYFYLKFLKKWSFNSAQRSFAKLPAVSCCKVEKQSTYLHVNLAIV